MCPRRLFSCLTSSSSFRRCGFVNLFYCVVRLPRRCVVLSFELALRLYVFVLSVSVYLTACRRCGAGHHDYRYSTPTALLRVSVYLYVLVESVICMCLSSLCWGIISAYRDALEFLHVLCLVVLQSRLSFVALCSTSVRWQSHIFSVFAHNLFCVKIFSCFCSLVGPWSAFLHCRTPCFLIRVYLCCAWCAGGGDTLHLQ